MAKAASTADVGDGAKAVEFYHMAFRHFLEGMEKATEAGDDDDGDGQELEASSVKYFLAFDFCPVDSTRSPGTRQARLALSDHGVTWKPIPGVGPSTGKIPDPIVRDGVWYVYYLVHAPRKVEPKGSGSGATRLTRSIGRTRLGLSSGVPPVSPVSASTRV